MNITSLTGVFASPWDIMRSLLDIAIVAYVIYRLLKLITGTRAQQLLKGLLLLLVFSVTASYLQLQMVNWLVQKLWILFAITLPIVFQPELRRLLEQLGRGSFFASHRTHNQNETMEQAIGEIVEAVAGLALTRTGALIIITKETGIAEYLESGSQLDAVVSASLLQNIFFPKSPLHDGAVIISNGRIERAGCFLPLSENPFLSRELGTRHRAGLGISEISDALVIIVSEETGAISMAREGKLERYLAPETLRMTLNREMLDQEKLTGSLWRRWVSDSEKENG